MAEHTPGPWETYVNDSRGYRLGVMAPNGREASNECLCEIRDWRGLVGGVAEGEADARLIAASPDLLAACEAIAAALVDRPDGGVDVIGGRLPEACRLARAALAKAKEES